MKRALLIAAACTSIGGAHAAQPPETAPGRLALGRLFLTPAERAALDVARNRKPVEQAPQERAEAPPPPQIVSYGGIVRRSDGKSMLWINNRLVEEKEALAGLSLKGRVRPDGSVTLQVPETGRSIEVKVGQSVEVQTGRVAETRKPAADAEAKDTKEAAAKAPAADAGAGAKVAPAETKPAPMDGKAAAAAPPAAKAPAAPAGAPSSHGAVDPARSNPGYGK